MNNKFINNWEKMDGLERNNFIDTKKKQLFSMINWKGDVDGDSTVTANFDLTTRKFSLSG